MVISILLRISAKTIRRGFYILDMDIALLMQASQYLRKTGKSFFNIKRFFVLGVGFVRDLDVEVEAVFLLLAEKLTTDNPAVMSNEIDCNSCHFPFLFQYARG